MAKKKTAVESKDSSSRFLLVIRKRKTPGRSMTMACNVLRTWPLGEDWTGEDEEEAVHAG